MLRGIVAAALVTGSSAVLLAQHTATLILTSGERVTGVVGFQGEAGGWSQGRGALQVVTSDGHRASVQVDEVILIDFVGGRPSVAELEALDSDAPHVLTLRNGNIRRGRLVGLVGGEFVRWENPSGARIEVPIRNVNRVYLDQEAALAKFSTRFTGWGRAVLGGPGPSAQTPGSLERGTTRREVTVDGARAWADTGLVVQRGERVRFAATGEVSLAGGDGQIAGPAGLAALRRETSPMPELPLGALVGRVGTSRPFAIGVATESIVMPAAGLLLLGVNDDTVGDNSGSFRVTVIR
jgi:hypothetical protein